MNTDQTAAIKVLEEMLKREVEEERHSIACNFDGKAERLRQESLQLAISALDRIRETDEMLEAAEFIVVGGYELTSHGGKWALIRKYGTVELYQMVTQGGDKWWPANAPSGTAFEFNSALEAFAEIKIGTLSK